MATLRGMPGLQEQKHPQASALASVAQRVIACTGCPRLVEHRQRVAEEKKKSFQDWAYWGKPVPGFGDPHARIAIIGLAPGAHGANRTGRVFTGDPTARFLVSALHQVGLASQPQSEHTQDGLLLSGVYMTAAVKCVPPHDRPTRRELENCFPYLVEELDALDRTRVVLTLGRVALEAFLQYVARALGSPVKLPFHPGTCYELGPGLPQLSVSYHPSPRNTLTGRLTREEFIRLLERARRLAEL